MSSRYGPSSRLIWSLTGSNLGTTIAAAGNSGNWQAAGPPPWSPNWLTPVDLRDVNDLALMVSIAAVVTAPTLTVNLDLYDDQGNLYPAVLTSGALSTVTTKQVAAGAHGAGSAYLVLPSWGRVSWTISGGSMTGVQIGLWGR